MSSSAPSKPPKRRMTLRWTNERVNAWLAPYAEPPIFPEVPILDAHHHVFPRTPLPPPPEGTPAPPSEIDIIFSRSFGRAPLVGGWDYRDWLDDVGKMTVSATVYVEAKVHHDPALKFPEVGETVWALSQYKAANNNFCLGYVGTIDLTADNASLKEYVAAHRKVVKGESMRISGFRHTLAYSPTFLSPAPENQWKQCIRGAKLMGSLDIPIDIWVYHYQIQDLEQLAAACPKTTFICDHFGTPLGPREQIWEQWFRDMTHLSRRPNVILKTGGLGMLMCGNSRDTPLSAQDIVETLFPYYQAAFKLFGENRLIFESNFPMDKHGFSYISYWNAMKIIVAKLTRDPAVRRKLLFANANRVYNLGLPLPPASKYNYSTKSLSHL